MSNWSLLSRLHQTLLISAIYSCHSSQSLPLKTIPTHVIQLWTSEWRQDAQVCHNISEPYVGYE